MGLYIALQKESCVVVEGVADESNLLHRVLPRGDGSLLSGIDWYGDTIFNGLQMKQFLTEWSQLEKTTGDPVELKLLATIQQLASRCQNGTHLYLKFVGD
jgi:hypothetical protein